MFRHYLGPALHLGVLRTRWERDLMSLLMKVKDVEYPTIAVAGPAPRELDFYATGGLVFLSSKA